MQFTQKLIRIVLIGISVCVIIGGLFLRFYTLDKGSYWYDELWTVNYAQKPISWLLTNGYFEPGKSLLYLVFFHLWIILFGTSEAAVRTLSATVGSVCVILFGIYTTKHFKTVAAFIGTALFSISWVHIWASREARYYSFLLLFSLIATILFNQGLFKRKQVITYIIACTFGLYTHILFSILIFSHFITSLIVGKVFKARKTTIYAYIIPFVAYMPYIYQLAYYAYYKNGPFWGTFRQLQEQLHHAPMNMYTILSTVVHDSPPIMAWIFGGIIIVVLSVILVKKIQITQYYVPIVSFFVLMLVSITWPVNTVISNWYYLYFLTPTVFIVLCVLIDSVTLWHQAVMVAIVVCICGYYNVIYIFSLDHHVNVWRYQKLSSFIQSLPNTPSVYFAKCPDLYMTRYYSNKLAVRVIGCDDINTVNRYPMHDIWYVATFWDEFWIDFAKQHEGKLPQIDTEEYFGPIIVRKYIQI